MVYARKNKIEVVTSQVNMAPSPNVLGTIQIIIYVSAIIMAPIKIKGLLRPHLEEYLSEIIPIIGSVKASTIRGIVIANPTKIGLKPNTI